MSNVTEIFVPNGNSQRRIETMIVPLPVTLLVKSRVHVCIRKKRILQILLIISVCFMY